MHHIYKTQAIVLNSQNFKESDKQLSLLTKDHGFMRVMAQGTRKMESKLRPSIQDFSVSDVAVVSGRTGWRLTNAKLIFSIKNEIKNSKLFQIIARTFKLVERLVIDESDDQIFDNVLEFVDFAKQNQNKILHKEQLSTLESIFVAKVLKKLGYLDSSSFKEIVEENLSVENINSINSEKIKDLNKIINQAIRESGL